VRGGEPGGTLARAGEEREMCDTTAFVIRGGTEEMVFENVDRVEFEGDQVTLTNIFGEQQTLSARLRLIDNNAGKLVFEPL
jgi:predicted RNA-binding protein